MYCIPSKVARIANKHYFLLYFWMPHPLIFANLQTAFAERMITIKSSRIIELHKTDWTTGSVLKDAYYII